MKYTVTHKESVRLTINGRNARYKSGETVDINPNDPTAAYFIKRGFLTPAIKKKPSKKKKEVVVEEAKVEDLTTEETVESTEE